MRILLSLIVLHLLATPVHACTLCKSDTATQVQAIVFGKGFVKNLAVAVSPFIVLSGIVVLVHGPGASGKRRNR